MVNNAYIDAYIGPYMSAYTLYRDPNVYVHPIIGLDMVYIGWYIGYTVYGI